VYTAGTTLEIPVWVYDDNVIGSLFSLSPHPLRPHNNTPYWPFLTRNTNNDTFQLSNARKLHPKPSTV
jgi:hypothetical protein